MSTDNPSLVTVITPTFNRDRYLLDAVHSVIAQTHKNWELIIVDDGSTDLTRDILSPLLEDSRIRYVYQENQGQSKARNRALSLARGSYICFLDSDDLWYPEKLERQLHVVAAYPQVGIVHGDEVLIDAEGNEISRVNMHRHSGWITPKLLADNSVSITTALVRKECFDSMGGFDASLEVADDYELWLRLSIRYQYYYLPKMLAAYRVMDDQISSDKRRRFEANQAILNRFLADFGDQLPVSDRQWGLARFYCRKARYYASDGERRTAFSALAEAFRLAPFDPVVWRALYRVLSPKRVSNEQI